MAEKTYFTWHVRRQGGMDQILLSSAEELRHLSDLDPKLWGALSCPASGLEYDARTMAFLDADHDGRIRIPEVQSAVAWACRRLKDPAILIGGTERFPLSAIETENEEGRRLYETGRKILAALGRGEDDVLTQEDVTNVAALAAKALDNGDGVIPAHADLDESTRHFVELGLGLIGGVADASGEPGLNHDLAGKVVQALNDWLEWRSSVHAADHPLGKDTPAAWDALQQVKAKIDDFFLRTQMLSFAPQTAEALNAEASLKGLTDSEHFQAEALENLPLAYVEADGELPMSDGLNPLWKDRVESFFNLAAPLLEGQRKLSFALWKKVQDAFAPYRDALAKRPALPAANVAFAPSENAPALLDDLGEAKVETLLEEVAPRFMAILDKDISTPGALADIAEVERLVLYARHLYRLLMNFVSFSDFYSMKGNAIFQAGTLFMDGRSCRLCVPVDDVAAHSTVAALSQLCLVYCECRLCTPGEPKKRTIVAAMTDGDDDFLMVGRNGIFVDNTGQDWDATLVKIVTNPTGIRQAVWSPYKKISRMIGTQIEKFATTKVNTVMATASKAPAATAAPVDISRSVGIFAAVGIALGAIGTAIGSIASALFSLSWWQYPLVLIGLFVVVSGPSVFLAWLKLRKRTLAPLLEASGWAVNNKLPVNLKLGNALTDCAVMPDNTERQSMDLFQDEESHFLRNTLLLILAVILICCGWQYGGKLRSALYPAQQCASEQSEPKSKLQAADKELKNPAVVSAPEKK